MKRIKMLALLLMVGCILIGVCGCMKKEKMNSDDVILTARQIEILKEKGLPQEYNLLTDRQRMTITDIEEMLQAVENKYGEEFRYVGYTAEKQLESGVLTASPKNSRDTRDLFTVQRDETTGYIDTYMQVVVRDAFEDTVFGIVTDTIVEGDCKLYSAILDTSITMEQAPNFVFFNNTRADNWLFLSGTHFQKIDIEETAKQISSRLEKDGLLGSIYIIVVDGEYFGQINEENYTEYLSDKYVIGRCFRSIT